MFLKLFLTISVIIRTDEPISITIIQSIPARLTVEKYFWKNGNEITIYCNAAEANIANIKYLLLKNNSF